MLRVVGLRKRFGRVVAVDGVSFDVERGSYFTILGPSGCGKTTLLRIIAGLYEPDEGEIYIDGDLVNGIPPHKRGVSLMFQSYALFPHMSVFDNIAYGLRARKIQKLEIEKRVREVARILGIEDLLNRYPHQLSGGQQQRVALARALVIEPKVLLLDEPLSNLDAKVRARVRLELRKIQRDLGLTVLHVTHDQEEALSIADKIVVMNLGRVEQIGSPLEIYRSPRSLFVADFIGTINLLEGIIARSSGGSVEIDIGGERIKAFSSGEHRVGEKIYVGFRPESISIMPREEAGENMFRVRIRDSIFMGPYTRYIADLRGREIYIDSYGSEEDLRGREVYVKIPPSRILLIRS